MLSYAIAILLFLVACVVVEQLEQRPWSNRGKKNTKRGNHRGRTS